MMQIYIFFIILFTILNTFNGWCLLLTWFGGKSFYNMSYIELLSGFNLFRKQHDNLHNMAKNNLCNWRRWSFCTFLSLFVIFIELINSKLLCLSYMMFLDTWAIILSIYEYFILLFIFLILLVYPLSFLRKQIQFCV